MLIRDAEIEGRSHLDLRIVAGRIEEIGSRLPSRPNEAQLQAQGGALLPGLNDHHLHLLALAAADASLRCGPPQVRDHRELRRCVESAAPSQQGGWLRAVGYHESVAGSLDRSELDALSPGHPIRMQHRSGALWTLNSAAVDALQLDAGNDAPGVERDSAGRATGRLYRLDAWLGEQLGRIEARVPPKLAKISQRLAAFGVTGLTDATPSNGADELALFHSASERGELRQRLQVMGSLELPATQAPRVTRGAFKILLHEDALPSFDGLCDQLRRAHGDGRAVAFHCVTRAELVFAAQALAAAGSGPQPDRIEHAAVAPPELVELLKERDIHVVTQPNFIYERGDAYLDEVAAGDLPWLYRCGELLESGVATGAGTDAPFGDPDPWLAMQAAVERKTEAGVTMGADERVSPERALALFTSPLAAPGAAPRRLTPGAVADLCLLDRSWSRARDRLSSDLVASTFCAGELVHSAH